MSVQWKEMFILVLLFFFFPLFCDSVHFISLIFLFPKYYFFLINKGEKLFEHVRVS